MIVKGSPHSCRGPLFPRAEAGRTERERKGHFCLSCAGTRVSYQPVLSGSNPSLDLLKNTGDGSGRQGAPFSGSREGSVELSLVALMEVKNAPLPV